MFNNNAVTMYWQIMEIMVTFLKKLKNVIRIRSKTYLPEGFFSKGFFALFCIFFVCFVLVLVFGGVCVLFFYKVYSGFTRFFEG